MTESTMTPFERRYTIQADDDGNQLFIVAKLTDEGIIIDVENDDEVIRTWAMTAQEFYESGLAR